MIFLYGLVLVTVVITWKAFEDFSFYEKHVFRVDPILIRKEYSRMFMSGFLHSNYLHLGFNMFALFSFGEQLINTFFSPIEFAVLYAGSLLAGSLLLLYIHRNHGDYSAVGASGAVSGVVFASVALIPNGGIGLIFIPGLYIPSWLFGLIFVGYSIFGIRSQRGRIAHEAHLGGALGGLLLTLLYFYNRHQFDYRVIAAILIPSLIFLYFVVYHPEWMITGKVNWGNSPFRLKRPKIRRDFSPKTKKQHPGKAEPEKTRTAELNELLDKVNEVGYNNLSEAEKRRLDQLSR
ncbi:MAG: rhomboid family intramembrane serine protease [Bacteroidia bacterium]|nr:rhomboid family intramembrane serine protease [Bacteroidia bacterium]